MSRTPRGACIRSEVDESTRELAEGWTFHFLLVSQEIVPFQRLGFSCSCLAWPGMRSV